MCRVLRRTEAKQHFGWHKDRFSFGVLSRRHLALLWFPQAVLNIIRFFGAVARIALVKPDKARMVENAVIQMAKQGRLFEKVCRNDVDENGIRRSHGVRRGVWPWDLKDAGRETVRDHQPPEPFLLKFHLILTLTPARSEVWYVACLCWGPY
jgi:hypothetical protein